MYDVHVVPRLDLPLGLVSLTKAALFDACFPLEHDTPDGLWGEEKVEAVRGVVLPFEGLENEGAHLLVNANCA